MSQPLDPLTLPLTGSWLIEASAGTGKTYTLAALYVRLVLGHDPDTPPAQRLPPLSPGQILVMTFTEAAASELRERIRLRLTGLADWLRRDAPVDEADVFSRGLLASLDADDGLGREQAAIRLALAADLLDDAAISTIHSWCLRMLREHALYSGNLFDETLDQDDGQRYREAVRDYWRTFVYPLSDAQFALLASHWPTPDTLANTLRPLLGALPPSDWRGPQALGQALTRIARQLAELKQLWPRQRVDELRQLFAGWQADKRYNGTRLRSGTVSKLLDALETWASTPTQHSLDASLDWSRLSPAFLAEVWKKPELPPVVPALEALAALPAQLEAIVPFAHGVLAHAGQWVGDSLARHKRREAVMDFDDLLTRLDAALRGPDGERLASAIRRQFPAALVDEFQDTDPLQYRMLDTLYPVAQPLPGTLLAMIGDPKQAIYAFRGGDIFTYLNARRATAGRHVSLDSNFRSTTAMVAQVNQLFAFAEQQHAAGAFAFADETGERLLPFEPVRAAGRREVLLHRGQPLAALNVWLDTTAQGVGSYREQMAERCADSLAALLAGGQSGDTGFVHADGQLTALCPADIAILVRDGSEARSVRQALARRGVRTVYLSDRDSVYASREAQDLLHWLRACAEPTQERLLRTALATATLDLPYARLDALNDAHTRDWDAEVERFVRLHGCWQREGILPMLRQLLQLFDLPARCLTREGGERTLTNLLHLAELLHAAAEQLDGEQALMRYLAEQMAQPERGGDERMVRLESDAGLVRVVTIHKSKGLEYPLVCLPFAASYKPVDGSRLTAYRYHDPQPPYAARLSLFKRDDERAAQDRERLQEDLRLFYVAVTRARHALWLGIAPLRRGNHKNNTLHESALGYLLAGGATLADTDLTDACRRWLDAEHAGPARLAINPDLGPSPARLPADTDTTALGEARTCQLTPAPPWRMSSYSALILRLEGSSAPLAESGQDEAAQEIAEDIRPSLATPASAVGAARLGDLPTGPASGVFIHSLLEWMAQEGFATLAAQPSRLRDRVARGCALRQWEALIEPLSRQLEAWLHTPLGLPGQAVTLAQLEHYQPELEFWFAAHQLPLARLDQQVQRMLLPGQPRPQLRADRLNGMLKGFVDLVLCHEGRYYVVDYKTNFLGPRLGDYGADALTAPLAEARYDLQAALYLLALHRHLRERLPDYDCARHLGGAVYLFLRGWDGAGHGVWHACPDAAQIHALDALFAGQPLPGAHHADL